MSQPKLQLQTNLMTDSIESNIKDWLKKQGYPLEMRVASAFQEQGFSITQSDYFRDPESDKYREIDVIASIGTFADEERHILFNISFVVECKNSNEKPWLLFQGLSEGLSIGTEIALRQANEPGRVALLEMSLQEDMKTNELFKLPSRLSYGITRAFGDKADVPYEAVLATCKATNALAQRPEVWSENRISAGEIFFPVVLVEGKLFECFLNTKNEINLLQTNRGTLIFRNPAVGSDRTVVDVITLDGLPGYLQQIEASCQFILDRVKNGLPRFKNYLNSLSAPALA